MIINFNDVKVKTSEFVYTPGEDSFFLEDCMKGFLPKILKNKSFNKIAEMGCGSGYITINLMKLLPNADFYAIDINQHAIDLTLENLLLNNLNQERIHLIQSDLFSKIPKNTFDLILFNPPYLPKENDKKSEVNNHPLVHAWEGGELIIYNFLNSVRGFLSENGFIMIILSNFQVKNGNVEKYIKSLNLNLDLVQYKMKKIGLETLFFAVMKISRIE